MKNRMILKSSITKKLCEIFQADYSEIVTKIMIETETNNETSEEDSGSRPSCVQKCIPRCEYEWVEKQVKSIKDTSDMFTTNMRSRKTDLLVLRLTDATEILYIEVSGPPYKPDKKHTVGDAKKLLIMDICNLCRTLSNNFDCPIDDAKKVRSYNIQAIGDRLTLFAISLVDRKKYLAIELSSFIRNEFLEQEKLQKKIWSFIPSADEDNESLREWIHFPDADLTPITEDD
ncbi:31580_t:CDS:2, partial [Gigaspora margarita]